MIDLEDGWYYDPSNRIGGGMQGNVYPVFRDGDRRDYALKIVNVRKKRKRIRHQYEIDILKNVNHRNIIEYVTNFEIRKRSYLIMERCEHSLEQEVQKKLNLRRKFDIFNQLLDGFQYLHDLDPSIYHLDIKPQNILFCGDVVKISDFGIIHINSPDLEFPRGPIGPRNFRAPELEAKLLNRSLVVPPSPQMDIYSLGKIWYYTLTNGLVFKLKSWDKNLEIDLASRYSMFSEIFSHSINENIDLRFNSVKEFKIAFGECIDQYLAEIS